MKTENIEKGKWNDGDINPKHPDQVWVSSAAGGKGDWRKKKTPTTTAPTPHATSTESVKTEEKKTAATAAATTPPPSAPKVPEYDAPKPTITYTTKKPADMIDVRVPEKIGTKDSSGRPTVVAREAYRKSYANLDGLKLINILNNHNIPAHKRQMAYEEALHRGIPENKIDVSGTLQEWWDDLEEDYKLKHAKKANPDEEESYDLSSLRGMNVEEFMAKNFPDAGDDGWMNPDNPAIRREFHNLETLGERRRYDAFVDYQKRQDPFYETPIEVLQGLARDFAFFARSKKAVFISTGGAGAGKTYQFNRVAKNLGLTEFDENTMEPGENTYNYVMVDKDIEDAKGLSKLLSDHNGKLIVFDDKDKAITSDQRELVNFMKSLGDSNPKMRKFRNTRTGKGDVFTGKLLFISNKTPEDIIGRGQSAEDHKAVLSRAAKNEIHFTVNENLELLKNRYKTMGTHANADVLTPQEEAEVREKIYKLIVRNQNLLDPMKFTVRKFEDALEKAYATISGNKDAAASVAFEDILGGNKNWAREVVRILNKGWDTQELGADAIEKGKPIDLSEYSDADIEFYIQKYEENPESFNALFGKDFITALRGKKSHATEVAETEEEVVKAFESDLSGMTLEDAESLLLG